MKGFAPTSRTARGSGRGWVLGGAAALALAAVPGAAWGVVNAPHIVGVGSTDNFMEMTGYEPAAGPVTIDVLRGSLRIGTSGPVQPAADTTVLVNIPLAPDCWKGWTPDIVGGDVARVTQGGVVELSRVRDLTVTPPATAATPADTVEIKGTANDTAGRPPQAELALRLINPAFQGLFGGPPRVDLSPLYDGAGTAWTATRTFVGPSSAAALSAALGADAEIRWIAADLTEFTAATPAPGPAVCPVPFGQYAATRTTPNVITNDATGLTVEGAAPTAAGTVLVTLSDGNAGTPDPTVGGTLTQPAGIQGKVWSATFAGVDVAPLAQGVLTASPVFDGATPGIPRTVLKDPNGPPTTITSGPGPGSTILVSSTSFAFTSIANDVAFECSLDDGAFAPCGSPNPLAALRNGTHRFAVRARDGAVAPGPVAQVDWTVNAALPNAVLQRAPKANTRSRTATFAFAADLTANRFECRLDAAAFTTCASGITLRNLRAGRHNFQVRAVDPIGNVGPATVHRWRIDRTPPILRAALGSLTRVAREIDGVIVSLGRCNERCTVHARVRVVVVRPSGGRTVLARLNSGNVTVAAGTTARALVDMTSAQIAQVRAAILAGRNVRVEATVIADDASGNRTAHLVVARLGSGAL